MKEHPFITLQEEKESSVFYNTISLKRQDLQKAREQCKSQEKQIYYLFEYHPINYYKRNLKGFIEGLCPTDISYKLVEFFDRPIMRHVLARALSNLVNAGKLEKTEEMVPGPHGKPEHIWRKL